MQGYADDLLAVCARLDLPDVIFVGHSVSAMIGIRASVTDPTRFSLLVLVAPSPRYIDDDDYVGGFSVEDIDGLLESLDTNYLGWSGAMAPVIMGNPERPELGQELTNSFCRTDPEIAKAFARVTFLSDSRADLPMVRVPSLVLQCADDPIAPTAVGEYVHDHLAGSEIRYLAATGHCPNLSARRDRGRHRVVSHAAPVKAGNEFVGDIPLESAEELYHRAPCGYLSTRPDGTIVRVNQTFLVWTGFAEDSLIGRRFVDLLTPGGRIFHETHFAPLLHLQGEIREIAFDLSCPEGGSAVGRPVPAHRHRSPRRSPA